MNSKKAMLLFLTLSLLLTFFVACDSKPSSGTTQTTDLLTDETFNTDDSTELPDHPLSYDMDGKEFTIFTMTWCDWDPMDILDIGVEAYEGTSFVDAAYNRILEIESKYNCTVTEYCPHDMPENEYPMYQVEILSGGTAYDIGLIRGQYVTPAITDGVIQDLSGMSYINTDNAWWDSDYVDAMRLRNKTYSLVGDFTFGDDLTVYTTFFDKKLMSDLQLEAPYELVKNGSWTWESLNQMATVAASDLDNDGIAEYEDRHGLALIRDVIPGMWLGVGCEFGYLNDEGYPELTYGTNSNIDRLLKVADTIFDRNLAWNVHTDGGSEFGVFTDGYTLFCFGGMYYAGSFRDSEREYGIVPTPKWDESQTNYRCSSATNTYVALTVPYTNADTETTGLFIEAFAYKGYTRVKSAYYDSLVYGKYAQEQDDIDMLANYVYPNMVWDTAALFDFGDSFKTLWLDLTNMRSKAYVTYIDAYSRKAQEYLVALMEQVDTGDDYA